MKRAMLAVLCVVGVLGAATGVWAQEPVPGAVHAGDPLRLGEAKFDPAAPAELEVKQVKSSLLLVKPRVNGQDAGWFIFDTGAGVCVISTPHVERLGLKQAGNVAAVGVGGNAQTPIYRAETVVLGPMTMADHPMIATDLSFLKQHLNEEIVGVIGFGVLSRSVAEMDLETKSIALHDPASYKLAKGAWGPLNVGNRTATVRAKFDGGEGDFGLDTGANGYVTFHEPITREKKLLEGRETTPMKLGGVGGFVEAKAAKLAWFELGGVRVEDFTANFAIEAKGAFANAAKAGNIGTAMLKPFTMVLDYSNERIALVKREGAEAAAALTEPEKIERLLTALESSDAVFIRNGTEHSGKDAAEHLRGKLKQAGGKITTAAEFIEQLASKSSLSGKPYQVRTPDGKVVEARAWFEAQLRAE
jgi:predicted aspartyl protease